MSPGIALVLLGATLIDGTGGPPISNAVVVVQDGSIVCAGAVGACAIPSDAEEVQLDGHWIIPGLIDTHVHFSQTGWADGRPDALDLRADHPYSSAVNRIRLNPEPVFQSYLCSGVTTVFDVGGFPWTFDLRERAQAHPRAPRISSAGPLLSTRDHWLNLPAERQFLHMRDRDAVREGADYLTVAGTDAIKIWYLRSGDPSAAAQQREHLELAGSWARQAGIPLIVHATGLEGAREAVQAGAHLLVHSVEDREVDDDFVRLAARSGVFYNPTLSVYEGYQELRERRFDEDRTDIRCVDPQTLALIRSTRDLPGGLSPEAAERSRSNAAARDRRTASNLRAMHAGGVPVVVGTDAGNPLTLHGPAIFREMEAMQEAGLTPMQVLVAATLNGARVLGLEALTGTIEAGKAADLVVLGSDPLADITNVRQIRWVMREGTLMSRDELQFTHPIRPEAPGANPFR